MRTIGIALSLCVAWCHWPSHEKPAQSEPVYVHVRLQEVVKCPPNTDCCGEWPKRYVRVSAEHSEVVIMFWEDMGQTDLQSYRFVPYTSAPSRLLNPVTPARLAIPYREETVFGAGNYWNEHYVVSAEDAATADDIMAVFESVVALDKRIRYIPQVPTT